MPTATLPCQPASLNALRRKASPKRIFAVADCTYDWESWHGTDGRLIWVNPAVERLTGYSVAECHAMGITRWRWSCRTIAARLPPSWPPRVRAPAATTRSFASCTGTDRRSGPPSPGSPCPCRSEGHLGFRTSVRDTTERRKLRDQLRLHAEHLEQLVQERTARIQQLERHRRKIEKLAALGQLAAGVAHEINNPLAGLRNAFELIKADLTPQHPHFELLELIDREIERVGAIIHQMYQLYGRAPQRATEFDFTQTVREVVELLSRVATKSGRVAAAGDGG